jgi:hypothetical protein
MGKTRLCAALRESLAVDAVPWFTARCAADGSGSFLFPLAGLLRSLHVSANAQFAFGAISRPRFALRGQERAVALCAALAADPDDPLLAPYAATLCTPSNNASLRLPGRADFIALASACNPGATCDSFAVEHQVQTPDGRKTRFGFDEQLCDVGAFCRSGQQGFHIHRDCPQSRDSELFNGT